MKIFSLHIAPLRYNKYAGLLIIVFMLLSNNSFAKDKADKISADISGTWVGAWHDPMMGEQEIVYELKSENGIITGYQKMSFNTDTYAVNGKINGNLLELTIRMESFGTTQDYITTGEISGNELKIAPAVPGPPADTPMGTGNMPSGNEKPQGVQNAPQMQKRQISPIAFHRGTPAPTYKPGKVDYKTLAKISLPAISNLPWNGLAKTPPMGWNSWNKFH